jgi:hypothetical protein
VAQLRRRDRCVVVRKAAEPEETPGLGLVELGDVLVVGVIDGGQELGVGDALPPEEAA